MVGEIIIYLLSIFLFITLFYIVSSIWFRGKRSTYLMLFFAMGLLLSIWSLTNGTNVLLSDEVYLQIYPINMLFICIIPSVLLRYILYFTKSKYASSKYVTWILSIMPAISVILIATNFWHGLIIAGYNGLRPDTGPLFFLHAIIAYTPIGISLVVLFRYIYINIKKTPSLIYIGLAFLVPIVCNLLYTFNIFKSDFDFTPFTFLFMFLIFAIYSIRLRLFDIKEVVFTSLFVSLSDAFLVVDNSGTVADANPAFRSAFSDIIPYETLDSDILDFLKSITIHQKPDNLFELLSNSTQSIRDAEITVSSNGNTSCYSLSKDIIKERGQYGGYIITLTNISNYRQMISEINEQNEKLIELKDLAESASKAKSEFLSRMSHEIRTPMNAIIGMSKIADDTNDLNKIKHCISMIELSSGQLLSLINDVLDMSKIEAGKFELDINPLNIEKILMRVCNLIVDKTEHKHQKLILNLGKNLSMHYLGDELRISQVITNLLSNAVKFTPEQGTITLSITEIQKVEQYSILRFVISDTGIGITKEQIDKLFLSFEQADGSISRRFGGTGLGLAISKSIIEKMGGRIWVESIANQGSTFSFEIKLERCHQVRDKIIFDGITPDNLHLLIVDEDDNNRKHFINIVENFGIKTDEARDGRETIELVKKAKESNKAYDVIFLDYDLTDQNGVEVITKLNNVIDKNTVVVITSLLEWSKIQNAANNVGVTHFISKPLFPSSILDTINEIIGNTVKTLNIQTQIEEKVPDFSNVNLLLAEDIDINREIFITLLEETHVNIDIAENGLIAVEKFKENHEKYDIIIMDIQMPHMDGCEATRNIRALNLTNAKTIPIVAMTANAFKEDVEMCINSGMNDHLSKPIVVDAVLEKIKFYTEKKKK